MHIRPLRLPRNLSVLAVLGLLGPGSLAAENHYLRYNQFSPHNWESVGKKFGWHTAPEGADTVLEAFVPGADYFNNGFVLRTIDGELDEFDGRSLTLSGGALELRYSDPEKDNQVGELIITDEGSVIENGVHTGPAGLHIARLTVNGPLGLGKANKGYRTLRLRVDKLVGAGDLQLVPMGGVIKLSITDAKGYTGDIVLLSGKLDFDAPLASAGGLSVIAGATVILDQPATFAAATINGVALSPGTHSFEELASTFPGAFADGGSGSITVESIAKPVR